MKQSLRQLREQSGALFAGVFLLSFLVGATSGAVFGVLGATVLHGAFSDTLARIAPIGTPPAETEDEQSADSGSEMVPPEPSIVTAVKRVEPAVVSIVVTKDVPTFSSGAPFGGFFNDDMFRQFFGESRVPTGETERRQVGGGTGFFVTADGLIITNKHVVADTTAEYTVFINDGRELTATVVARDPVNDLALIQVAGDDYFPVVEFGDSDTLALGETVIAIGNALGEFRNTVSVGVVSGLSRSITASGAQFGSEQLFGVIQTDAAINSGNSGGPLINVRGEVIGINTAVATGGQNIGFAIPANDAVTVVKSVEEHGRIVRPFLGVRYVLITERLAKENQLPVTYGALLVRGDTAGEVAVTPGSPADLAGLRENDIILTVNGERVTFDNPLVRLLSRFAVGDNVSLTILRQGEERTVNVTLVERQ